MAMLPKSADYLCHMTTCSDWLYIDFVMELENLYVQAVYMPMDLSTS